MWMRVGNVWFWNMWNLVFGSHATFSQPFWAIVWLRMWLYEQVPSPPKNKQRNLNPMHAAFPIAILCITFLLMISLAITRPLTDTDENDSVVKGDAFDALEILQLIEVFTKFYCFSVFFTEHGANWKTQSLQYRGKSLYLFLLNKNPLFEKSDPDLKRGGGFY